MIIFGNAVSKGVKRRRFACLLCGKTSIKNGDGTTMQGISLKNKLAKRKAKK